MNKNSGFVAGTLVHTDKGLVPIQDIKVGDLVLSMSVNDTNVPKAYKRVIQTSVMENQFVWAIELSGKIKHSDEFKEEFLFTSPYHQFWTFTNVSRDFIDANSGKWASVLDLEMGSPLLRYDREFAGSFDIRRLYQTTEPDKAFYMVFPSYDAGIFLDVKAYKNNQLLVPNYFEDESLEVVNWDENEDPIADEYIDTIYNLEVEDFHTYFVGELGVWVHQ